MTPYVLERTMAMALLMSSLALNGVSSSRDHPRVSEAGRTEEACPPCELLFSKLERTGKNGMLAQDIRVQERGEPKSGTGLMYFWASAGLRHACIYLQELFGEGSCQIDFNGPKRNTDEKLARFPNHSLLFEPALGGSDARCSCDTIDRVSIVLSMYNKHMLPVRDTCAFSHSRGIGMGYSEFAGQQRQPPCKFADGTLVQNIGELWQCMHEADCDITDDWLQMGVYRDPRPTTVSTFYFSQIFYHRDLGDMNDFVVKELPIVCQWLAVRYILFSGFLADQSMEFWYGDATDRPLDWHYHWFHSIGLQLPFHVVEATAKAAAADNLGFNHKSVDEHPGEEARNNATGVRRFEDEVSREVFEQADAVLRIWLPPLLLERFGVVP